VVTAVLAQAVSEKSVREREIVECICLEASLAVPIGEPAPKPAEDYQMGKTLSFIIGCFQFGLIAPNPALAATVIVGVNYYNEGALSKPAQDAEIERLAQNGVKSIRTGLGENSIYFITQAFHRGIGSIVLVSPDAGSNAEAIGRWSRVPLSGADPQGFVKWLDPLLSRLERAGVRLTAVELGNEINTSGYNADIAEPGSGRVLGITDLNNPDDAEARVIAGGLRNYVRIAEALKAVRDHSKLNTETPILLAGLADWGPPSPKAWDNYLGVSVPDTIQFLRQNGLDKFVDGYGVHIYPNGDPHLTVSVRAAQLEQKVFSECRRGGKPCWLTEWGIPNGIQTCPIDDTARARVIQDERQALKEYADRGRLAADIYYIWNSLPNTFDPMSVFRCGALTDAGKVAIAPM
jgi:hypothetical protein